MIFRKQVQAEGATSTFKIDLGKTSTDDFVRINKIRLSSEVYNMTTATVPLLILTLATSIDGLVVYHPDFILRMGLGVQVATWNGLNVLSASNGTTEETFDVIIPANDVWAFVAAFAGFVGSGLEIIIDYDIMSLSDLEKAKIEYSRR